MRRIHFLRSVLGCKRAGRIGRAALALALLATLTGCVSGGYYSDGIYYPSWYGADYYGLGAPGPEVVVIADGHHHHRIHEMRGTSVGRAGAGGVVHIGSAHAGGGFHGGVAHGGGFHGGGSHAGGHGGGGGGGHHR